MEISLSPSSDTHEVSDPRWAAEVAAFRASVADVASVRIASDAAPGEKGAIETLIVAIGTARLIPHLGQILQTWLDRDRKRSVTVTWEEGTSRRTVTVDGGKMSDGTLQAALTKAIEAANEPPE